MGAVWLDGVAHSRSAIDGFEAAQARVVSAEDQADWSDKRKIAYEASLSRDAGETLAVLRIPSTDIEVPVFSSTGDTALNRGAGHIEGTALPDADGNIGIAGHRDGFFRGLKDIEIGARIELSTLTGVRQFRVVDVSIVDPLDVSVLDPDDSTELTLVTCYPFYFVGSAPDRFIVHATLVTEQEIPQESTSSTYSPANIDLVQGEEQ